MTPGDPTEQLPRNPTSAPAGPAGAAPATSGNGSTAPVTSAAATAPTAGAAAATTPGTTVPRIPMRPEDVDKARADAKAAKEAAAVTATRAKAAGQPARPVAKSAPKAAPTGRRVRLTVSRIDPWSALKMSFLLSVALGIALVVATITLWLILAGMGAFDQVNNLVGQIIQDNGQKFDIMDFVGFGRVVSLSIVFAVIDVFLWTAVATLGAFIYNVSASLVGGLHLTLTDD